jgi:light-regulated signal transduction histidine kinase (bacteriophytochrome)
LAIAKAIVEAHAGRLTVDCRIGGGSTFRMWLPMAHARTAGGTDDLRRVS